MKNLLRVLLLLFCLIILVGCWDGSELSEIGFVTAMSIDIDEDNDNIYAVALEIPKITHDNQDPQRAVKSGAHRSLNAAVYNIGASTERKIFLGHMKALICGEELLEDAGMFRHAIDTLTKDSNVSRTLLVLAAEGRGSDVMESNTVDENLLGAYIANFFHKKNTQTANRKALDCLPRHFSEGTIAIIPRLKADGDGITFSGAAIVYEYELKGWLDENELLGLSWLNSKDAHLSLDVDGDDYSFGIDISKYKSRITFFERGDELYATIIIELEGDLEESPDTENIPVTTFEQKAEEHIQSDLQKAFDALYVRMGVDGFSLRREFEKNYPKLYEHHLSAGSSAMDIPILFDINVKINSTGNMI